MNISLTRLKRIALKSVAILIAIIFVCLICACDNVYGNPIYTGGEYKDTFEVYDCFSVNFLDVGEGDAVFINFADGKTMLIDSGEKNDLNLKTLRRYIDAYAKDGLDYLLLTHPDSDHTGNAETILENYTVDTAFIPDLLQPENFETYYSAYSLLKESEKSGKTKIVYSATGNTVVGEDYCLIFLSPNAKGTKFSAYDKVNSSIEPNADDINDLSPIIYLEYKGVRFIFTGDAGFSQEEVALDNVDTGIINRYLKRKQKSEIDLTDVDFLKVAHHGAADASGDKFLMRLTPKNAVISVGGNNIYGHPRQETLNRILAANENCNFYLTSEKGNVSVLVANYGEFTVKTDAA